MNAKVLFALLLLVGTLVQSLSIVSAQTVSTSITLYPTADNYADSKYPSLGKYGRTSVLYVGNSYDRAQNIWGFERIYIRFDVSAIPRGRQIAQAVLSLWQFYAPAANQTYETHRVLGDWDEATQNWNTQPAWAPTKTSEAIAPAQTGVAVKWDITDDVRAWYSGQARNYGTMIKVQKEERVVDASSGFYSREYPVDTHEEWRPKLILSLQPDPAFTYSATMMVTGLPNGTMLSMSVDGRASGSLSAGVEERVFFDRGTTHTIGVSSFVSGPEGVRYRCDLNETQVSSAASHVFAYSVEYLATFSTEPGDLFATPPTGWYASGTSLSVKRNGADMISLAPGSRLIFDGWYLNSKKLTAEPTTVIVDGPITLQGRYRTEYYLNVTSPIGNALGSGWYTKGSTASFTISSASVPAEGLIGLLGTKRSFARWAGSNNFLGAPVDLHGSVVMNRPTEIEAIWQDDYSSLITNVAILFIVIAVLGLAAIVTARRRRRHVGVRH
jgi:hypothetical protein